MIKVPLNAPTFGEDEINSAIAVLRSGFVTMGSKCLEFEQKFADHMKVKNAIFVNSGSSANLLGFFALANVHLANFKKKRLVPGSEVIVPAVTWSTTVWPVLQAGCVPVLVDCDPQTLQMKRESVEKAISPKTAAICPVHVLGNAVEMDWIIEIASKHNLVVFEDTCEALGTKYRNKYVGTIGDIGTYSFFFSHHITTIEGGMVVTDNDELAELMRAMRAHGWTRHLKNRKVIEDKYPDIDPRFLFITTGFNLRPTEINAAFGLSQIDKLEAFNQRRREIAEIWITSLKKVISSEMIVPMKTNPGVESTWFGFPVLCKTKEFRNKLRDHLESRGIETRPIIAGNLARQPAFQGINYRIEGELDGANTVMDRGLFWGSHPLMKIEEINHVTNTVLEFCE